MKKIIFILASLMAVNVFAADTTQAERDSELVRAMEINGDLESADPVGQELQVRKTDVILVKFKKKGIAKKVAKELGLKLVKGAKKRKTAMFKVRSSETAEEVVALLEAHPSVVKVKQEQVFKKYYPK